MKNQAVLEKDVEILSREEPAQDSRKIILKQVCFAVLGVFAGMFQKDYGIFPFAPALVAAAPPQAVFLSFLGSALGSMLNYGVRGSIGYIAVLLLCATVKMISSKSFHTIDSGTVSGVFSSLFILCYRIIGMIYGDFSSEKLLLAVSEAVLCFAFSYFFRRGLDALPYLSGRSEISKIDICCLCISAGAAVCCAGGIGVSGVHPAHIPVCIAVLFFAYYGGVSFASVCGMICGAALSLGTSQPMLFVAYSLGGLAAGVFSSTGHYFSSLAFFASSGASLVFLWRDRMSVIFLIECAVACIGFSLIPVSYLDALTDKLKKRNIRNDNEVNMQVALSLRSAAGAVEEINEIMESVSESINETVNPEMTKLYARIQHKVCADCKQSRICWDRDFDITVKDIREISEMINETGSISRSRLTGETSKRCIRFSLLCEEADKSCKEYVNSVASRLRAQELRDVVSDQLSSMARFLYDVSIQITESKRYDENKSRAVKNALLDSGIHSHSAVYRENIYRRGCVEIKLYEERENTDGERVRRIISAALKKRFREAEVTVEDFFTVLTYYQKPEYEIINGIAQIPCGNNRVCGDCARTSDSSNGNFTAIISDGMGTGRRAYIDGSMTAVMMHKLISAGFTFTNALSLVNSALLVKSGDESFATVDAACINTFSGKCVFYKAGAAASYIRRGDTVKKAEDASLPVGILRGAEFATSEQELQKGDIVLMMSDGGEQAGAEAIEDALLSWSTDNMQELASHIASLAKLKGQRGFPDDITVIALKVKKSR